jgi:hypothetical protein
MCWCIYVSVCPSYVSMNLCMFVSAYLCVYVSMHRSPLSLSLSLSRHLSVYLPINLPSRLSIYPSICISPIFALSICLPTYVPLYLSNYLSIYLYFLYRLSNPSQPWIFCHPIYLYLVFLLCIRVLIKNLTDIFMHISVVCNVLAYAGIFVCLYVCIEAAHCNANKRKSGNIM